MHRKERVLIVEDEKDIAELMQLHLKREGCDVEVVDKGEDALERIKVQHYSLLVLDWMLPGISGLDLCKKLRTDKLVPQGTCILMVTARAQAADIVLGLEVGADDYLTKPFDLSVFLARARALFRRAHQADFSEEEKRIQIGELAIDCDTHEVKVGKMSADLTPSEFKLLFALMKNRGRVLTRDRLIQLVQGEGVSVIDRAIDTHIFGLRKKLGDYGALIETIRGVGYRVATNI
jgi:two-component system, OmpR family, phosphate regulon response regulator PhoB